MIESLPVYISITFILTTFLTVGFLVYAVRQTVFDTDPARLLIASIPFWLVFQAILALGGFYQKVDAVPPRVFAFGVLPAAALIAIFFLFFRDNFVDRLPLKILTLLHVIRIPVEIVLLWLFQNGLVPRAMTFEGSNFDILSGITAPIIYFVAFRKGGVNRPLLIGWNLVALLLLINIVTTAVLAFPGPMQQIGFDQPNLGITIFPYIWLPTVIVPIVLFSHLASLWKLLANNPV